MQGLQRQPHLLEDLIHFLCFLSKFFMFYAAASSLSIVRKYRLLLFRMFANKKSNLSLMFAPLTCNCRNPQITKEIFSSCKPPLSHSSVLVSPLLHDGLSRHFSTVSGRNSLLLRFLRHRHDRLRRGPVERPGSHRRRPGDDQVVPVYPFKAPRYSE
jgi:hypothetical protein